MTTTRALQRSPTEETRRCCRPTRTSRFYAEHGWYLSKKLLTDDEIDELVEASERYYAGERDRRLPAAPPQAGLLGAVARATSSGTTTTCTTRTTRSAKILRKPLIGAVAARLAQADEIRVFQSTLIYKPPVAGEPSNIVPWHFDKHYWSSSSSERMLTAFIPFHDCARGDGHHHDGRRQPPVEGDRRRRHRRAALRRAGQVASWSRCWPSNAAYNGVEVVKVPMIDPARAT